MVEPERERDVVYDVDVAVAGGGVAGVFAALGAARQGAETVLIDRFGYPGGNIGPGMINAGGIYPKDVTGPSGRPVMTHVYGGLTGIPKEYLDRHAELCGRSAGNLVNANVASYLAMKMMEEAGVKMLLSAYASDPIMEGNRVTGLFVETKSGRQAVRAKVVIDATGEADVARRAGGPVLYPRPEYTEVDHHSPTGAGLYYTVGGVDSDRWERAREQQPAEADLEWAKDTVGTLNERRAYLAPHLRRAWEADDNRALLGGGLFRMDIDGYGDVSVLDTWPSPDPGIAHRCTGFVRVDMADGVQVSRAEAVARMAIFETVEFYRNYVPGFEGAYLLAVAPYFGSRGGPCIEGEHTVTLDDFEQGRRFPDVLFIFGHVSGGKDVELGHGDWTDLPYRCMLPKELAGLIAVGRSASGIPDTIIRGRTKGMHMGELGGIAAALSARNGTTPKALEVKELQRAAIEAGYYLGDEARLQELGLA
ncbi:MAG: FAD-dependent oxidoreductase [Candidatus Latescibacteria bacterium]|nr:FAD-dependent oxidoreductase [Candidatus Latescibacterota bacterium]